MVDGIAAWNRFQIELSYSWKVRYACLFFAFCVLFFFVCFLLSGVCDQSDFVFLLASVLVLFFVFIVGLLLLYTK